MPVPCNVNAACNPDIIMRRDVIEKPRQSPQPSGAPGKTAMQPDRHHAWPPKAILPELIEAFDQVIAPVAPGDKARCGSEAHIVGIEGVGQDTMITTVMGDPIG